MNGYDVRLASHGKEALEHLQRPPQPSIILLDMSMPVMDGHRLLTTRKANEALHAVPVVIISAGMAAMNPRDRALYAANYDVAAFLKKPADPQAVLETIERHALRLDAASVGAPA
jgi:CheY-like chemotaxis protein